MDWISGADPSGQTDRQELLSYEVANWVRADFRARNSKES